MEISASTVKGLKIAGSNCGPNTKPDSGVPVTDINAKPGLAFGNRKELVMLAAHTAPRASRADNIARAR